MQDEAAIHSQLRPEHLLGDGVDADQGALASQDVLAHQSRAASLHRALFPLRGGGTPFDDGGLL